MPLYIDIHKNKKGLTKKALEEAHQKDLAIQDKYGTKFKAYWFNEEQGTVFCMCEAPSKEAAESVHREAHGGIADEVIEVQEGK